MWKESFNNYYSFKKYSSCDGMHLSKAYNNFPLTSPMVHKCLCLSSFRYVRSRKIHMEWDKEVGRMRSVIILFVTNAVGDWAVLKVEFSMTDIDYHIQVHSPCVKEEQVCCRQKSKSIFSSYLIQFNRLFLYDSAISMGLIVISLQFYNHSNNSYHLSQLWEESMNHFEIGSSNYDIHNMTDFPVLCKQSRHDFVATYFMFKSSVTFFGKNSKIQVNSEVSIIIR